MTYGKTLINKTHVDSETVTKTKNMKYMSSDISLCSELSPFSVGVIYYSYFGNNLFRWRVNSNISEGTQTTAAVMRILRIFLEKRIIYIEERKFSGEYWPFVSRTDSNIPKQIEITAESRKHLFYANLSSLN